MSKSRPEASVIIVVHDDQENLVGSVRSAANQTVENLEIIVVDDCSNDESFALAKEMAKSDSRIRPYRTPRNSGGPGAPRNVGIEAASAPWITFLDSDDDLEPRAIELFLAAAREDDADVVCGQTRRLYLEENRFAGWHPVLYRTRRHLASIDEFVDLVIDTTATGKLYRRSFLIETGLGFAEGLHYEDLVFTAQAYTAARSISVIPDYVYLWKVYPNVVRKSITNRRDDEVNLEHRLEAIQRVDEVIAASGNERLYRRYQLKFLKHDARLYLRELAGIPRDQAQRVLSKLEPRLRSIPDAIYELLPVRERLLYGVALAGFVEGVREIVPSLAGIATLEGVTHLSGGSLVWLPSAATMAIPETGSTERRLLDITTDRIVSTPFPLIRYAHRAQRVEQRGEGCVLISGVTADPIRKLVDELSGVQARVDVHLRGTAVLVSAPLEIEMLDDGRIGWQFRFEMPAALPVVDEKRFDFSVRIDNGTAVNVSPVMFDLTDKPRRMKAARGSLGAFLRHRFAFYQTNSGRLALKQMPTLGRRGQLDGLILWFADRFRANALHPDRPIKMKSRRDRAIYGAMRMLPLRADRALFESHAGAACQDSPRHVSQALWELRPEIRQLWVTASSASGEVPHGVAVSRSTVRHLYHLSTAKYLVADDMLPAYLRKRAGQVHVQTWHGIPVKAVGLDDPGVAGSVSEQAKLARRVADWDYLSVPDDRFEAFAASAFSFHGTPIRGGSPRNDALVRGGEETPVRPEYGLDVPGDRTVVLYAPTARGTSSAARAPGTLRLNLDQWIRELGDDYYLLVRSHPRERIRVPRRYAAHCMDVSEFGDINELYRAAQVLITDYSSVIFDYLHLDRPIIVYAYDHEKFVADTPLYVDPTTTPPGPVCRTQAELHAWLAAGLDDAESGRLLAEFRRQFWRAESGTSARDTVATIWG